MYSNQEKIKKIKIISKASIKNYLMKIAVKMKKIYRLNQFYVMITTARKDIHFKNHKELYYPGKKNSILNK